MNVKDQVKLFKNIIENEYRHIQDNNIENKCSEYRELIEKKLEFMDRLKEISSSECFELISELDDINTQMASLEQRLYFKEGVRTGINNLNFLSEYETKILL